MTSHVEQAVAARIAAAHRKAEEQKRRREELAAARASGVAKRHAQKLYRQAHAEQQRTEDPMPREPRALTRAAPCPACRVQRTVKRVATVTVNGAEMDVVGCPVRSCELLWCVHPERPRIMPAAA
ncbi:hypothetical protein [Streptomyces sp. NBC_00986]|uniref:hypothetical protein n=1 Tax=Streptomyces sp. NBC_00986 TaxID=2903702 RepID=UPI00386C6976|nr:hypothetical protein OG504_39215 [Streptomyces sp. NBC_00986]